MEKIPSNKKQRKRSKKMGIFYASCLIENHIHRKKNKNINRLLVDTGSEFSWISEETLQSLAIKPEKKDAIFMMANGKKITRDMGFAVFYSGDSMTIDEVVFARKGDMQLLGARTLEGLNLKVDPRNKRLMSSGPYLAAVA